MFALWPAHLYTRHGEYMQSTQCIYAMRELVSDDKRVFLRKAVVDGVLRFHEADPDVPNERASLVEISRQMDAEGV